MENKTNKETIFTQIYKSPCGELILGSAGNKLCLCIWTKSPHHQSMYRKFGNTLNAEFKAEPSEITMMAARQLDEYFSGIRREFDIPLLMVGTEFQKAVWSKLRTIPYGKTITYGEQARSLGKPNATRAIGLANGANPIAVIVPCHRVVGSNGVLTGYAGGIDAKQYLLELEERVSPHT